MNLDCFGSGARFHHIGIAVSAINDVLPTCQITHDAMHGVNVAFVSLHGCSQASDVWPQGPQLQRETAHTINNIFPWR